MGVPRHWVQAFSYPIPSEETPLILVVLRDVTEFRRTEAVRRDFVANVSHDLRTPIASLKALVETLLDGALEDQSVAREFLSRMEVEVDDLVRLVEELLQLSRVEAGQIELRIVPGNIGDVMRRVAERLRAQASLKEIEIAVDIPEDLPLADFDPERVEQVLVNLVQNAIKFTPKSGLTVLSATSSEREIVVEVRDSGPGLDPLDVERVFERFYKADRSRAASGSGLGLAIAKHMIQLHGGRIWVESDYGRGATFKFSLPRAQ
jgi:two-component system phosphate regulon sensor histidine kinase PhoR